MQKHRSNLLKVLFVKIICEMCENISKRKINNIPPWMHSGLSVVGFSDVNKHLEGLKTIGFEEAACTTISSSFCHLNSSFKFDYKKNFQMRFKISILITNIHIDVGSRYKMWVCQRRMGGNKHSYGFLYNFG